MLKLDRVLIIGKDTRHTLQQRIVVGVTLSSSIAAVAYWRKMLTRSGVAGTIFIGTIVFGFGGLVGSVVIIFFFVSSSLLSRLASDHKRETAADKFSKSATRDLGQTLANGGVGALAIMAYRLHPRHPSWLLGAFVGAFATATADTWATEIGTLHGATPRLITSGRQVPPGTSGGITMIGTAAAGVGALALSVVAGLTMRYGAPRKIPPHTGLVLSGMCGGIAGALFDSLLGATRQHVRYCPNCGSETERHIHHCGTETTPLRGVSWMDNDMVNLLSTSAGAVVTAGLAQIWTRTSRSQQ